MIAPVGCLFVVIIIYGACLIAGLGEIRLGSLDAVSLILLSSTAIASIAVCQLLWIWGAGGLAVLFASLNMNVAPFYFMAIVVVFMGSNGSGVRHSVWLWLAWVCWLCNHLIGGLRQRYDSQSFFG